MLRIENLQKSYGANKAVDGVSFQIETGETLGLLGPNGAGKTTTIGILTGAITADSGEITIGESLSPQDIDAQKMIGVAPQTLALYEELTARENLSFFASLYGLRGDRLSERISWALRFAELEDRRNDRVSTYSGGMKRRLNMAAALVHDPQIIVMDEPTVGVDPQSRNHIFDCIEQLQKEGRTILYTTHYMEEAQRLCQRIAIMDHGKVLDLDTTEGLLQRHGGDSLVSAELTRSPPPGVALPNELDGQRLRFESEAPLKEISRLVSCGVEFATLEVARPNLEGVFLSLTGRKLRDG